MSIGLIVTDGFGTGSLSGSIADIVTSGYTIGTDISVPAPDVYAKWAMILEIVPTYAEDIEIKPTFESDLSIIPTYTSKLDG